MTRCLCNCVVLVCGFLAVSCPGVCRAQHEEGVTLAEIPNFGTEDISVPLASDVRSVFFAAYNHPFKLTDVASCRLPSGVYARLLNRFRNSVVDRSPASGAAEICSFLVVTQANRSIRISVFFWAKAPRICFSMNGLRYVSEAAPGVTGDGALAIDAIARHAAREPQRKARHPISQQAPDESKEASRSNSGKVMQDTRKSKTPKL